MSTTFLWDPVYTLIESRFFTLRWYNLLWAISLFIALPIWYHMFHRAGKDSDEAERLARYITIGLIAGARLGHVLFYDWSYFKNNLLQIFLPFQFHPTFKVVGFSGLASHGAMIGIVLAIIFYLKRMHIRTFFPLRIYFTHRRSGLYFLWIVDHLVILVALGGGFIRIGNLTNSEIIGKPTNHNYGMVFLREVSEELHIYPIIQAIRFQKSTTAIPPKKGYQPIQVIIDFNDTIKDEKSIETFLQGPLKNRLVSLSSIRPNNRRPMIQEPYGQRLSYRCMKRGDHYQVVIDTLGILRHPAQLYEAISCLLLFVILFTWWYIKGQTLAAGRLTATFFLVVFSLRFFYEYYKENQVIFEDTMWLNMGQLLSLPPIIIGIVLLWRSTTPPVDSKNIL